MSSSGWHSPCGIITWGHTEFPVPSFIPGHGPRDTGMGSGCPERCLGPCRCRPAHAGLPAILLPARPAPPQPGTSQGSSTFPALGFPPLEASVAPAVGSPLLARSGVCGWGPRCGNLLQALQGTRGKHNSDAAAVQLLPVGCGGCVPEGPSSAVPRCQLCLCGAEPFQPSPAAPGAAARPSLEEAGEETIPQCSAQATRQRSRPSFSPAWPPGKGSASAGGSGRRPGRDVGWHT